VHEIDAGGRCKTAGPDQCLIVGSKVLDERSKLPPLKGESSSCQGKTGEELPSGVRTGHAAGRGLEQARGGGSRR
jgi:hypothetical protein